MSTADGVWRSICGEKYEKKDLAMLLVMKHVSELLRGVHCDELAVRHLIYHFLGPARRS